MKKLTILFLIFAQVSTAQSGLISDAINNIEFEQDSIRSVFDWISENIRYDVGKLNELTKNRNSNKNSKFKSEEEYSSYLLKNVIKNKKGVCEDYSLLFHTIVIELGFNSQIIEGYTKNEKGNVEQKIGHTWNAVEVNGNWKLYDPTWGAGYIENDRKFVKKYFGEWYDVDPNIMIETHMPFDPMWQLLEFPVSYENFRKNMGVTVPTVKFSFEDLIKLHKNKGQKEQMQDQVVRSKEMGRGMRLVEKWRRRMSKSISLYGITSNQDLLEESIEQANGAVVIYNKYQKRPKRFKNGHGVKALT